MSIILGKSVCIIAAVGFGILSSGGVLTVLLSVGLVPRFIQRTNTACDVIIYENYIILGAVIGGLYGVFPPHLRLDFFCGNLVLIFYGFFSGIFEGCVAITIAEMLDALPICERRLRGKNGNKINGMKPFITSIALGKMFGSLFYFYNHLYRYGG